MKKLLPLLLLLSLLFTFSACGDNEDEPKKEEEKPFVWEGDWNDPTDPNYKAEYGGKYNPIKGTWLFLKDPELRFVYTEDFEFIREVFNKANGQWVQQPSSEKYIINGTGYNYEWGGGRHFREYKIVKENSKTYLISRYQIPLDEEWSRYELIE